MEKNLTIRTGEKADLKEALDLIKELALFEKSPQEVTNTLEDMERDGFGKSPVFQFFVAIIENRVVGIALYFIKYSTWKGKGIYLDDIVVNEKYRQQGIGKMLFDAVIKESQKLGAKQIHWQVLDWNDPAIQFYKKYGASFDSEWINCKMNEIQINNYNLKHESF